MSTYERVGESVPYRGRVAHPEEGQRMTDINDNPIPNMSPEWGPECTPQGGRVVAWSTYGQVRGMGPRRATIGEARRDLADDMEGCGQQGGYSDRAVIAVDVDACCWHLDGEARPLSWVRAPGSGALRSYEGHA